MRILLEERRITAEGGYGELVGKRYD